MYFQAALLEYAAILLLLKKRRKPLTEIQGKEMMSKPVSIKIQLFLIYFLHES